MKTTLILGAGFSKNSGVPVQSEIPEMLITGHSEDKFECAVTDILKRFISDIFGYDGKSELPGLDDIFTCIDISTNSGHHLGIGYSPIHLRTIRRLLVYRVFSILEENFKPSEDIAALMGQFSSDFQNIGFVVLNWDTVVENYIRDISPHTIIDYCNGGMDWEAGEPDNRDNSVKVIKIHGSCNWLYCDNCRSLLHDSGNRLSCREKAGFQRSDFEMFGQLVPPSERDRILTNRHCRICGNVISSHIATFSYRKSFRANSFPNIWDKAEEELAASDRWVFIGYSLPEADYEFKHLLKIAQLKLEHRRSERLKIDVVLLNSDSTTARYKGFFGSSINRIFNSGVKEYLGYLRDTGTK